MDRRAFLAHVGAAAGSWAWQRSAAAQPRTASAPAVEIELRAAPASVGILPGPSTRVWRYQARVLSGPQAVVQALPDSYLGPLLRFQTGQRVRIHFVNDLPEPSIVHWHGLDVPTQADGHPRLAVGAGQRYTYEFDVINRAGTYWYHPHPHMRTAYQAYHGLAGVILVTDPVEASLGLPSDGDDLVCVIQDREFDAGNQLVYLSGLSGGMPMDSMNGFLGSRILVNGRPGATRSLAAGPHRLRLLNGSNSRVYKLAWEPSMPFTVIGTDGGLLERPVQRRYLTLAPGERVDTILDLSSIAVGRSVRLTSLAFPSDLFTMQMGMGMRGGMGRGGGMRRGGGMASGGGMGSGGRGRGSARSAGGSEIPPPQGAALDIMTVTVDRPARASFVVPARLSSYDASWQPPRGVATRVVKIDFQHMRFLLGGREFDMQDVAAEETVRAGATQIWAFDNSGPAMMNMRLGHPMHLHGRQFRVLERQVEADRQAGWDTLREGFVDEGWKDTTLVLPGERVQLLVKFSSYPGIYLYHCHNLEHEDMGMMRNFKIV